MIIIMQQTTTRSREQEKIGKCPNFWACLVLVFFFQATKCVDSSFVVVSIKIDTVTVKKVSSIRGRVVN